MKLVELNTIFDIQYGNQFDLYKLETDELSDINFVSRSSQNLGVMAKVSRFNDVEPFPAGLITVTLGGTYLLSSFIQQDIFYTAQNIKVLKPKREMSVIEKLYYCKVIEANRYRYTSHGREANITLDTLLVPDRLPEDFRKIKLDSVPLPNTNPLIKKKIELHPENWKYFKYNELFSIERGKGPRIKDVVKGNTPFVTSIDSNNGITNFIDAPTVHSANTISVNRNGSVAEAFYQPLAYCSTEDVHIFTPKFKINKYIALFFVTLIKMEKYRYSYGRKWGLERMKESIIKLPVDKKGSPDFDFMEDFVKSLPYSSSL
ncbi:MAG: restriction endonuclease subunit S [Nitrospirae bacterium]|nr:restriction endonuclease subunit S [Nitrospirota bacterium]